MPSFTSCSSSLWRPCSLSASCLFSATICGSWERTGRLSVCKNQFDSIALIQLWTGFFWLICYQFPETFSAPVFTNGRDKSGFSLGCSRNLTEVFGDRAKYWMLPVFSRWADCERNADLYHTNHDITGYFWGSVLLFVFKWWSVCLLKQHAEFKSTSCSSKLWRSQLKLRLDFSSLQSGRWTFLCHQTGAHRSWASKQCPPAKR